MIVFLILLTTLHACLGIESQCSKFHYEEKLLEKMIRVEMNFEQLKDEFRKISTDVKSTLGIVSGILEEIKTERRTLREDFLRLNTTALSRIEEHLKLSNNVFQQKENHIARMSDELWNIQKNITESVATPIVGFKATSLKSLHPSNHDTLVFPKILFNIQDGYDSSTGIFTAPVRGLYLFITQICTYTSSRLVVDIIVNGQLLGQGQEQTGNQSVHQCNTAEAFGYMDGGQTAYTRINYISGGPLHHDIFRLNSFSGALINKG